MHQAIHPKLAKVFFWVDCIVNLHQVWADVIAMFNSANGVGKGTATMSKRHTEVWELLEHATKYQRANSPRSFSRHAHQPGQPIFLHFLFAHHLPRVNK